MVAVPVPVNVPLARGVPRLGRNRRLVQVNEQVTPALLALVTVKVTWFVARAVIATAVPLATRSTLLLLPPVPPSRVIMTVGAVPFVSKLNPDGALSRIVPIPTSPLAASKYTGPVSIV